MKAEVQFAENRSTQWPKLQNKTDKGHANDTSAHMPGYFWSSITKAADKGASEV